MILLDPYTSLLLTHIFCGENDHTSTAPENVGPLGDLSPSIKDSVDSTQDEVECKADSISLEESSNTFEEPVESSDDSLNFPKSVMTVNTDMVKEICFEKSTSAVDNTDIVKEMPFGKLTSADV